MRNLVSNLIGALVAAVALSHAEAADLTVAVHDRAGAPAADAVVTFVPATGIPPGPIKFPWPSEIDQKDTAFRPFVRIAPVGAEVVFHNLDPFRHHIYSFSKAGPFELKLFGPGEIRRVAFAHAGTIALGCNIHDRMMGFIRVVDTPFAAKTDAQGQAVLSGLPDGRGVVTIWHPFLQAPDNTIRVDAAIPQSAPLATTVDLLRPPPPPSEHDGMEDME